MATDTKIRTNRRRDTRKLFVWLDVVRGDPELSPVAFKVAYEIGQHFNARHGGAAWPSSLTIARNIGVSKPTVIRVVRQLRERGHLTVEPGRAGGPPGRGHSNRYRMSKPELKGPPANPSEPRKGPPVMRKGPPVDLNYLEPPMGPPSAVPKREREGSRSLTCPSSALAPIGGALEERKEGADQLTVDRFADLLAIWQRPWGEDEPAAHRAFADACREADACDILTAAHGWAIAVEPRFLKPLATWLSKGLWKNQPPQRKPTRNGNKVSLSALALEMSTQYSQWGR